MINRKIGLRSTNRWLDFYFLLGKEYILPKLQYNGFGSSYFRAKLSLSSQSPVNDQNFPKFCFPCAAQPIILKRELVFLVRVSCIFYCSPIGGQNLPKLLLRRESQPIVNTRFLSAGAKASRDSWFRVNPSLPC